MRCCRSPASRRSTCRRSRSAAHLPGASAETMATSVAAPLERQLAQIAGVASMSSTSSLGRPHPVEFDLGAASTRRAGRADRDQRRGRTAAQEPPRASDLREDQSGGCSPDVDRGHFGRPADLQGGRLCRELCRIEDIAHTGVGLVDFHGEQKPAIRVQVDPTLSRPGPQPRGHPRRAGKPTVNAPRAHSMGQGSR